MDLHEKDYRRRCLVCEPAACRYLVLLHEPEELVWQPRDRCPLFYAGSFPPPTRRRFHPGGYKKVREYYSGQPARKVEPGENSSSGSGSALRPWAWLRSRIRQGEPTALPP